MDQPETDGEWDLERRPFLSLVGAAAGGVATSGLTAANEGSDRRSGKLDRLSFYSTASQIAPDGESELTDDETVVVWAEPSAENLETTDDGPETVVYEDADVPLVSTDGPVVGFGTVDFVSDDNGGFRFGNEQFLLNVFDENVGGDGTVLWDEGHDQFEGLHLENYESFRQYAADAGYDLEATTDMLGASELRFPSTASQVSPDGGPLTGEPVLVRAEETAENVDEEGDDATHVYDEEPIPLVSRDDSVFGFGTPELLADDDITDPAVTLVRNVLAETVGEDGTVVWDDAHDSFYDASRFETLAAELEEAGYSFEASEDLLEDGFETADALAIASPATAYTDAELEALESFVDDGNTVLLFDESEFVNEETATLNEIAATLDLAFRFNADQVEDSANNAGVPFVPTTRNVADSALFEGIETPGLEDADGVVVATPRQAFSDDELAALESFVDDGNAVFLFDQSDFGGQDNTAVGFDETENLNEIAAALELSFRFNSDQVNDDGEFDITTNNVNERFDYFEERDRNVAVEFERGEEYYGRVVRVFDGDTFEVEFDSEYDYREVVRHIGIDTSETPPAENEPEEWFGIPDDEGAHLIEWGGKATQFSLDTMAPDADAGEPNVEGRRVKLTFDPDEPIRGNYGRLLSYMFYDPDEFDADPATGEFSVNYNEEAIAEGYARVYSSGFSKHDEWAAIEERRLAERDGIWSAADFDALEEIRNDPVDEVFVPNARSIRSRRGRNGGRLRTDRVPLMAARTATQERGDGAVPYEKSIPLAAVDDRHNVALVGGVLIHERYEDDEFDDDPSTYGNFPFLTNLFGSLSATSGDVLLVGGQGQFNVSGSISLERCELYLRYLEGLGTRLRQINDVPGSLPDEDEPPRAVIVTAPERKLGMKEVIALRRYRNDGGAVVLLGSADADEEAIANLNDLAKKLNTDLRFNDDRIVDDRHNFAGDPKLVATDAFNHEFDIFGAATLESEGEGEGEGEDDTDEKTPPGWSGTPPGRADD